MSSTQSFIAPTPITIYEIRTVASVILLHCRPISNFSVFKTKINRSNCTLQNILPIWIYQ